MAIKVLEAMLERAYGEAKGRRLQREARKWADSHYHLNNNKRRYKNNFSS